MNRGRRLALLAGTGLLVASSVAGAAFAQHKAAPQLTIFAASSLTNVFPQIDSKEKYSFGASNTLAAQIQQGLPADVFASANTSIPKQLYSEGYVTKPVSFIANKLVIVVPASNPAHIHNVYDLKHKGVKFVMAAKGVPVGDYTRKCLAALHLSWLVPRAASQEPDTRSVLAQVTSGEADAGFVYVTDAKTVSGQVKVVGIPKAAQPKVVYAAAAVKSSKHLSAAKAWVKRLLGSAAQKKLLAAGFLPLQKH